MSEGSILVIEDEVTQLQALTGFLEHQGFRVFGSESGTEGLKIIREHPIDMVLTDYKMPDMNGLDVIIEVKKVNPEIAVILMTAFGDEELAVSAMKEGAFDYLTKPIENLDELDITIRKALEKKLLVSENRELREQLEEKFSFSSIISGSSEMEEVINMVGRAASSKANILIRGESGTGKELIARVMHYASPRKDKPFIAVNCAALSENLLESELFGHEKGAFTGADRQHKGRFEKAHEGTLFIDELGDIPMTTQTKLLRVLQERKFERVGGDETIEVDVRLIAATNRNLEEMMEQNQFRSDLFYRLNVVCIRIPPLRERKSDIASLISYFISRYTDENDKNIQGVSREAMDMLVKYHYPGNVRELENAIERAVIMARGQLITTHDLPIHIRKSASEEEPGYDPDSGISLPEAIENMERHMIADALEKADGNQSKAADMLGISERNLRYKLKKYDMKK
ncbi:response regulator [Candidatus Poribacteria bacterium]|nr:response regulator [Candidatus Poribacteria bacterium]